MENNDSLSAAEKSQLPRCYMLKVAAIKEFLCVFMFVLITLGLSGCKVINSIDSLNGIMEKGSSDPEVGKLFEAEYAFYAGNYDLAEEIYTTLRMDSEKPLYLNAALYGLACISIATASDLEELKQGFVMLDKWREPGADIIGYEENPKMIAVALNTQLDLLQCDPEIRIVATKKQISQENKCRAEIEELNSTIKKLEHQISVLEAIDQEIQEKRKP